MVLHKAGPVTTARARPVSSIAGHRPPPSPRSQRCSPRRRLRRRRGCGSTAIHTPLARSTSPRPPATPGATASPRSLPRGCAPPRCAAMASQRIPLAGRGSARPPTTSLLRIRCRAGPWSSSRRTADRITVALRRTATAASCCPTTQAARMREDVARMYLLGFYRQAGPPAVLAAQIRDRDSDQVVYEAAWQQTSAVARTLATSTNAALVPGRNYRLWVAFNKPMRIRDDAGNVVAYRGQTSGASVGTVTLEFPDLTGQDLTSVRRGRRRVARDAGRCAGRIPALSRRCVRSGLHAAGGSSGHRCDRFRAVVVGARSCRHGPRCESRHGRGLGERTLGAAGGQPECRERHRRDRLLVQALRRATGRRGAARRFNGLRRRHAPPPPPPPPPPPSSGGGGGGGKFDWVTGVAMCLLLGRRRRRAHDQARTRRRAPPHA